MEINFTMVKSRKLLLPWYRYPPFSEGRIGGLSVAVWELTTHLGAQGIQVDVLTPSPHAGKSNAPPGVNVLSSELGKRFFENQRLERGEEKWLDDYDAILSVANYAARTISSYKQINRVARQIHAIGQDRSLSTYLSLKPNVIEYLKMIVAKRSDERNLQLLTGSRTLCVSEYVTHKMREGLEDPENLFSIPNGIETRMFRPMRERKEYDALFVGRFQKSKGLDILLRALGLMTTTKHEICRLAVVGEFSNEQILYLLRDVPSTVRNNIVFLGSVKREVLPRTINRAKLVVVPSRYESFGLPALEAIACGTPVLAARVGGLPEIVDDSVGVLVEPNDYRALAKAIYDFLLNPALAQRAATAGPEKAKQYDWDLVMPKIRDAIFS